jgi:hypothetical protein
MSLFLSSVFFLIILQFFSGFSVFSDEVVEVFTGRFFNYSDDDWQSTHVFSRFPMYLTGLQAFARNPLFGNGIGASYFVSEWQKYIAFVDSSFISSLMFFGLASVSIMKRLVIDNIYFAVKGKNSLEILLVLYCVFLFLTNSVYVSSQINLVFLLYLGKSSSLKFT